MSQPTASVDICNLALDAIGQLPISSILNPTTQTEDICARQYDPTRRQVLREFIFNFARKTTQLVKTANAPTHPEFVNGYSLPNDFIRLLTLGDRVLYGGNIPTQFFDFSAGYLYCDDLTDQGTNVNTPAPVLAITAIYRSGDVVSGITVPAGQTVVAVTGGTPIPGAEYLAGTVGGSTQANGNTYQIVAGMLSSLAVYFLQTSAGQNFDSSAWGAYTTGGTLTPTYVPPTSTSTAVGLEMGYIFDAQNVQQFDPLFINVLALQLAQNISVKFTLRPSAVDKLEARLHNARLEAAAIAGQEKPPRRVQRSRIRDVRRSGGIFRNNTIIGGWGN